MSSGDSDPYILADKAAAELAVKTGVSVGRHDVAVVLGSGWREAADALGQASAEVSFSELPGFPTAAVAGHPGTVRSVAVGARRVLCFSGRVHAYEGHSPTTVVHAVRTAVASGCRIVVLTNAAGAVSPALRVGQAVLISDHLNLTGGSPLVGPKFVDLSDLYSVRLRETARRVDTTFAEAVYAGVPGPHYETPAEVRMLRTLGADLVGMSTVWEAIAAREAGAEVLGISLVTNAAAGTTAQPLDHAEVLAAGAAAATRIGTLLSLVLAAL